MEDREKIMGFPICYTKKKDHKIIRLSSTKIDEHPEIDELYLCMECLVFLDKEGRMLRTI